MISSRFHSFMQQSFKAGYNIIMKLIPYWYFSITQNDLTFTNGKSLTRFKYFSQKSSLERNLELPLEEIIYP
ncbi:hypothetical protein BpHYR1_035600 [Brachionus plicatilis]|uniref:Uncharacterized protein n=1 Tax=Brachionus plicatilis TaxID=10195 RepID=A0A3M7RAJ4_BRAPC|nr:hypothetical protein BpHYR1_035600 [Brachionus plicatilis]